MLTMPARARAIAAAFGAGMLLASCGGSATLEIPSATATSTATATAAATTASAGAWTVTDKSKATIRVREQLVGVSLPSDAVLTAMTTLSSDERDRDNFVKNDTLQVRQFPTAEFVPTKTSGLTLPLATSGTFAFTLTGKMTIKGKTKEVTFDVTAKRDGGDLTATATASPSWKFGDFGMTAPSVPFRVLSVTDEIRAAIDIVATGPKG